MVTRWQSNSLSLQRMAEREMAWCLRINRVTNKVLIERSFAVVSRLGNGVFWYSLMLALLLFQGLAATQAIEHMLATGLLCLVIYKWLKTKTTRPRPCNCHKAIRAIVPPLDQYSFPSGHTLHAVAFSIVAIYHFPRLTWLLLPFTTLVALSRLILGLHYPSDVLAGALLGAGLAVLVLQL